MKEAAAEIAGVAMGQVSVPTLEGSSRCVRGDDASRNTLNMRSQAAPATKQTVIAETNDTTHHMKPHEAGTIEGATHLGFDGVRPQTQGRQLLLDSQSSPLKGFRVIGKQGAIIHIAQISPNPRHGSNGVVERIEVEIREILAGEVSDRQTPWPFQRGE